jgi:DNA-binding SARP family transcriptional activator
VSRELEFRVLGPVEVVLDGVPVRIGSPTQRTLLALLLMNSNKLLSTDRIVDVLWVDDPPEARRKLWFHVSKLRGILGKDLAAQILATRPGGYMLRADVDQLDAARFERLARSARSALEDDPARAAETLRGALALWRGEPFADVVHEDLVSPEVARLTELRIAALEDRVEADLALGRDGELIPELEALVGEHPYRERLRGQLMLALYRAGRQADALAAYRLARSTLNEELGLEPGVELKDLERRILAHDPLLGGPRTPHRGAARGEERKLVTVFFAELVEAAGEQLDPEDLRAFFSPYQAHVRAEIERFGGTTEKFIGGVVVALFGAPFAHEDDPERAVRAAIAIRDWMTEQGDDLHVRIGVATGEALVTLGARVSDEDPVAVGDVVNTAARLQAAAAVDGVLVAQQTFRATSQTIEYRGVKGIAAKEKGEPMSVWEAIRPRGRPGTDLSRHRSLFVGRGRELAGLHERLAWAASERLPQLVTILGVPGIGKTRLVSELQQAAARAAEPLTWRQGRSLPYGDGVSFWALGEMVKAEAAILESDLVEMVEHKLGRAVERIVDDAAEARRIASSLGALIGLGGGEAPAGDRRGETFAAWRRFVEALADEHLLVLVFEDLHWADDGLLDFVDELVDRVSGVPLLVVATARPELLARRPSWSGGKSNALTISLSPLSDDETARLVAALLERRALRGEVQYETLLARVGGNPLYAEQFCRILLEHGRLEELPESIHGIIAARLDLLADAEKRLLQDAAVVGKDFWVGALEAIAGVSRHRADELLRALGRREFVQRARRSSVAGDIEYTFAHELVRDVAYAQIPRAGRGERHRRAAEWIDSLGRPEDHAELLAHHYVAALDYTCGAGEDIATLVQLAVQALHRAGLRAMRLSANERAVEHLTRAIGLVQRLAEGDERSRTEAELQLQLGIALFAQRGFSAPEVEQAYGRATELMTASTPTAEQFPVQFGLSLFHAHRGHFERSMRLVEGMTKLASQGDEALRLQALHARWMNSLFSGQIGDAVAAADEGRAIYRPDAHHATSFLYGNHDPGVCALSLQALAFALQGQSVRAVTQMREAIALGETLGHAATLAQPLTQLPWALQINGDVDAVLVEAERALAHEDDVAHPQFFGIAHAMRGWALSFIGRDREGVAELEEALADELRASDIWAGVIGVLLAEVHLRHGRPEAARDLLDQTRSLTESIHTYFYEPELLRIEAEWLRLAGREDDARRFLLRAISTAREQGSSALAVRSALALAHTSSTAHQADLKLLGELCEHLPPENDTDYGRNARAVLDGLVTTTL